MVKFRASADGQHLMATAFVDSQNHEVSAREYQMNPCQKAGLRDQGRDQKDYQNEGELQTHSAVLC